ncbi:MAG: hypothetical protein JST00_15775 [Deltaproteobacteria bacterium]|nr:hypothetical protein [Deltaproteobacteria bacterium]
MANSSVFAALRRVALAGGLVFSIVAYERPCLAEGRSISWNVARTPEAEGCPDGAALAAAVARARGPEPASDAAAPPVAIDVAFGRDGGGFAATVVVRGATRGQRTLADGGSTCAALTDAVVATLTVLLDSRPEEPAAPPSPPPVAAPSEPAPTPAGGRDDDAAYSAVRIGLAPHLGLANFHRSASDPSNKVGAVLGGVIRVHPHSAHGVAAGFMYGGGVFGPNVAIVEASYSYALTDPRPLTGFSTAAYLEVGPSLGFVTTAAPAPDHTVLGAHASFVGDLQLANFTLGIDAGYRGGVPLGGAKDGWEGALVAGAHVGVALDFDARRGP